MYDEPKLIHAGQHLDDRGVLTFCNEFGLAGVKRFYTISNHRREFVRAWHGHARSCTWLWPISGIWRVAANGMSAPDALGAPVMAFVSKPQTFVIDSRSILFVPVGWYNGHQNLTEGSVLGVFSTATMEEVATDDCRLPWDHWPDVWEEKQR